MCRRLWGGAGSRRRTARVLDRCADLITLRDDKCGQELADIGVSKPEWHITADPALLIDQAPEEALQGLYAQLGLEEGRHYAMFVLRPWQNFSAQDRKSTRLNSSHRSLSRMPSSA